MPSFKPITLNPRTDFKNITPLEYIVMWEKGHEGNGFKDTPFIGYMDEDRDIYMYPEIFVARINGGERLPITAWSPIEDLTKK